MARRPPLPIRMSTSPDAQPARYFAVLYSEGPQRATLEALLEIEAEIRQSLRTGMDHQVAHARLQWWREECERAAQGKPVHPLTVRLVDTFGHTTRAAALEPSQPAGIASLAGLTGFVDTAIWDLAHATFESRRELTAYCQRWAAAMIVPLAAIAGVTSLDSSALGSALRELEMLPELSREAHSGRLRIPLDELTAADTPPESVAATPWRRSMADLVRTRHQTLRAQISRLTRLPDGEQLVLRGLLVWVAIACRRSRLAQRALPDVPGPGAYGFATAWSAWRAARKATTGSFELRS